MFSLLPHTHNMYKRNWEEFCLINLIYFALHIFQIRILRHCVDESWWNMLFKETRLGDGVADDAVATLIPLWLHAAALWRHAVWIRIVTSHNAWIGYEYSSQGRFKNIIFTAQNNGVCVVICLLDCSMTIYAMSCEYVCNVVLLFAINMYNTAAK